MIHSYINNDNIAWASGTQENLKIIILKQKYGAFIIFHGNRQTHARSLLPEVKARNIYQVNIQQFLIFYFFLN